MDIQAAVARAGSPGLSIETVQLEEPRADEIRVRIVAVGLCHTDLFAMTGSILQLPAVLGHEGAGVVEAVGPAVSKVKPGDRVAISFRSCGQCPNCNRGLPPYCYFFTPLNYAGTRLDGSRPLSSNSGLLSGNFFGQSSFATHAITYERNVVKVPDEMPLERAAPLGCGIQTGAGAVMQSLACESGSSLLIIGGGTVGLSAVMGAVLQGCSQIILVEPIAARRELARELGATHVFDPSTTPDLAAAVRGLLPAGVSYALDTSGRADSQAAALACLTPHGTLGLIGVTPPGTTLPGEVNSVITYGLTVKGIVEGDSDPDVFLPKLMSLHLQGRLPVDRLIRTYPLAEINQAMADQHNGSSIKPVLLTGLQ